MAMLLKGLPAATALTEELITRREQLESRGIKPCLAIVRVGERPDDISYETGAKKRCEKIGIEVRPFLLPAEASREEILGVIREVNADDTIHGCLMFRPLADKETEAMACALLDPKKDVDCMTESSLCSVFTGRGVGFGPCTAEAVVELLKFYEIPLTGANVAVIGRSLVIGKPVSMMLQAANATVTMCHTKTVDTAEICKRADIIVAAAGHAGTVTSDFAQPDQVIVDVGINVNAEGKLCGDVDFENVEPLVKAISPVPGGVGSMTTAVLCKHVIMAAEKCI